MLCISNDLMKDNYVVDSMMNIIEALRVIGKVLQPISVEFIHGLTIRM